MIRSRVWLMFGFLYLLFESVLQLCYGASSPALSDRSRFPTLFSNTSISHRAQSDTNQINEKVRMVTGCHSSTGRRSFYIGKSIRWKILKSQPLISAHEHLSLTSLCRDFGSRTVILSTNRTGFFSHLQFSLDNWKFTVHGQFNWWLFYLHIFHSIFRFFSAFIR